MAEPPKDVFKLVRKYLKGWAPELIFDVGAHMGESTAFYAANFPAARIHSFEPTPKSYTRLVAATADLPNVVTHPFALGREEATLTLSERSDSTMNRLLPPGTTPQRGMVEVRVRPGAEVLREIGADHIDFLKIDTEGHDYAVLVGFLPVLKQVDFIQVEAAMNPYNRTHVPLRAFEDLLWEQGFHLFHIFEQTMEWKRHGRPALRRSNPVFINGRFADMTGIS